MLGSAVEAGAAHPGFGIDVPAELRRDHDLVTHRPERLADQFFVGPRAIGLGGVEERYAELMRAADDADCLGMIGRLAIGGSKAHCPKADFGHGKGAKHAGFHDDLLFVLSVRMDGARAGPLASDPARARSSARCRQLAGTHGRNDAAIDKQVAAGHEPCVRPEQIIAAIAISSGGAMRLAGEAAIIAR